MPILSDGVRAVINIENEMTMIFGATASKKTRTLILPLMSILALARESMVVMDIKGELSNGVSFPQIQALLAAMGYDCRFLNFRDKDGTATTCCWSPTGCTGRAGETRRPSWSTTSPSPCPLFTTAPSPTPSGR